jgi:single-strand DNA-binding protein
MSATNSFHVIGNLTRDSELKYLNTGTAVANFSIAVNKKWRGNDGNMVEEVSFFDVALFGKIAESLSQYLIKGKMVSISGELKQERWEKDGQSHSKVKLIADAVFLVPTGGREGGGQDRGGYDQSSRQGGGGRSAGYQGGNSGGYAPPPGRSSRGEDDGYSPPPGRSSGQSDFNEDIPF